MIVQHSTSDDQVGGGGPVLEGADRRAGRWNGLGARSSETSRADKSFDHRGRRPLQTFGVTPGSMSEKADPIRTHRPSGLSDCGPGHCLQQLRPANVSFREPGEPGPASPELLGEVQASRTAVARSHRPPATERLASSVAIRSLPSFSGSPVSPHRDMPRSGARWPDRSPATGKSMRNIPSHTLDRSGVNARARSRSQSPPRDTSASLKWASARWSQRVGASAPADSARSRCQMTACESPRTTLEFARAKCRCRSSRGVGRRTLAAAPTSREYASRRRSHSSRLNRATVPAGSMAQPAASRSTGGAATGSRRRLAGRRQVDRPRRHNGQPVTEPRSEGVNSTRVCLQRRSQRLPGSGVP